MRCQSHTQGNKMAEGIWSNYNVKKIAEGFSQKRPRREWFDDIHQYQTSLKSWAHLCANQLVNMELEERQMIIFMYHMGYEYSGVQTFDPNDRLDPPTDFLPQNRISDS